MCAVNGMDYPKRKHNRLAQYDYNTPGAYFVTVCTKDRRELFWADVGASIARPQDIALSEFGAVVEKAIQNIPSHYPAVNVDKYVIMPNHIHLMLRICCDADGRPMVAPTISTVVQQMKGYVTKAIGSSLWQRSFHDHVVRDEKDYREIWQYIDENPMKWEEDVFFPKEAIV